MHQALTEPQFILPQHPKSQASAKPTKRPGAAAAPPTRQQCLQKYREHVLSLHDPERAGFGAVNAELMAVTCHLADVLTRGFAVPPPSIDGMQKMLPVLDTCHRLARQIERFGQLDLRIAMYREHQQHGLAAEQPRRDASVTKSEDLAV